MASLQVILEVMLYLEKVGVRFKHFQDVLAILTGIVMNILTTNSMLFKKTLRHFGASSILNKAMFC